MSLQLTVQIVCLSVLALALLCICIMRSQVMPLKFEKSDIRKGKVKTIAIPRGALSTNVINCADAMLCRILCRAYMEIDYKVLAAYPVVSGYPVGAVVFNKCLHEDLDLPDFDEMRELLKMLQVQSTEGYIYNCLLYSLAKEALHIKKRMLSNQKYDSDKIVNLYGVSVSYEKK